MWLALVAVVLALAAVLLARRPAGIPPSPSTTSQRVEKEDEAILVAAGEIGQREVASEASEDSTGDSKPGRRRPKRPLERKPNEGVLHVHLMATETGAPMPGVQVVLTRSGGTGGFGSREASRGRVGQALVTDRGGNAEYFVPESIPCDLWALPRSARSEQVEVPALAAGETRELDVALSSAPDQRFFGFVLDGDDDRPLAGAQI